jgi:fructoselysine-6-P-deglycase FrlB-like protein
MDSLEHLKFDFRDQLNGLNQISSKKKFEDCIYIGSGDSYVAGLISEYLSDHRCKCYSPSDLLRSRFLFDGTYYFISVTGKTRANIETARRATKAGAKTVAVTLNTSSELALACNEIIPLEIAITDSTTSFSTFTANVVTCSQLAGILVPRKFEAWHKNGIELSAGSRSVELPRNALHILGNGILYPIALYMSLKMTEFFGITTISNKLEEFCHSPLFGVKPSHSLWVLGQDENAVGQELGKLDNEINYFELKNSNILSQIFESIFFSQSLILLLCERYKQNELKYVQMKRVLKISSDIVYKGAA